MTQTFPRALAALAIVTLATIGLAGCAPATHDSGSSGAPGSSSTHVTKKPKPIKPKPALDTTAPAALLSIPCTSLATWAEIAAFQGTVTLISPVAKLATGDLASPSNFLPVSDYIRGAGGIDCDWSTGTDNHYDPTNISEDPNLEITVEFNAASAWAVFASENEVTGNDSQMCDGDWGNTTVCQFDHLVGTGTWIELYAHKASGPDTIDGPNAIMQTAIAAVTAAGTPGASPVPEAGTPPLGGQCTDLAPAAAVQTALGIGTPVTAAVLPSQPEYPDFIAPWYAAQNTLSDHPCVFETGSQIQALLTWIPGGAWAWAEDKAQPLADEAPQSLALTGLHVNDSAAIRCAAGNTSCVVDLVLGGNWIEATVPATSAAANKQTAATAVAQAIVTTVG
jgi:hypothetical protein